MTDTTSLHPLIQRLVDAFNYPLLEGEAYAAFTEQAGNTVLFCSGDPVHFPESLDVAVVMPELDKALPNTLRFGICAKSEEQNAKAQYGFNQWPTLIFLRDGEYVGAISGIQDWADYLTEIETLLNKPTSRPPSIGIAISSAQSSSACH